LNESRPIPRMTAKQVVTPKGPYRVHRERQRSRILAAAQEAFDARGIDRVLIGEIVAETGIRASTLYEYFASKDEIVWALVEKVMARSEAGIKEKVEAVRDSPALARITALLDAFRDELIRHPGHVRFMAQFDAMYARDWTVERLLVLESEISPDGFGFLGALVRQGIADGAIRADLDPDLTLHAVLNAVIGTQRRLASLGKRVEQEYGHPIQELFDETVRVLLLGLRAP
jgi:AcrR family transcriptional regulator